MFQIVVLATGKRFLSNTKVTSVEAAAMYVETVLKNAIVETVSIRRVMPKTTPSDRPSAETVASERTSQSASSGS